MDDVHNVNLPIFWMQAQSDGWKKSPEKASRENKSLKRET